MNIDAAAARISRQLPLAEQSVDESIAALADLMATLARSRAASDVPNGTGQATLLRLSKAQASALSASSDLLRVHADLLGLANETLSWPECPPKAAAVLSETAAA